MSKIGYFLAWVFATIAGPLVAKILKGLGFGIVAYVGASAIVNSAESYVFDHYNGMPSALWDILTIAGIDEGVKFCFSAVAARIAMKTTFANKSIWNAPPGSGNGGSGTIQL